MLNIKIIKHNQTPADYKFKNWPSLSLSTWASPQKMTYWSRRAVSESCLRMSHISFLKKENDTENSHHIVKEMKWKGKDLGNVSAYGPKTNKTVPHLFPIVVNSVSKSRGIESTEKVLSRSKEVKRTFFDLWVSTHIVGPGAPDSPTTGLRSMRLAGERRRGGWHTGSTVTSITSGCLAGTTLALLPDMAAREGIVI